MRLAASFFSLVIVAAAMFVELAMSVTIPLEWKVTSIPWSTDGVNGHVLAINGQFPGLTINAKIGDNIVVDLTNGLAGEGCSIHWHGIRQLRTPWADGAAFISQCPIEPGQTFKYNFTVDKAGTFFYHGHYTMQRTGGLYGMLIVRNEDATEHGNITKYDGEFNLLLSDWWHAPYQQQEIDLASKPLKWVGEPQSLLINGRGQYNCSLAGTAKPACKLTGKESYAPDILHVQPNKIYRLRLASTTSLASLSFAIGNHTLEVIEADGNLVEPTVVENLYIYPGQSYSVLIRTNQIADPSSFWVSTDVIGRNAPNTSRGLTILAYDSPNSNYQSTRLPTTSPLVAPKWNDYDSMKTFARKIVARKDSSLKPPEGKANKTILLLNLQNRVDNQTKWSLNNVSLLLPQTPFLASLTKNLKGAYDPTAPPETFNMANYDIMKPPPYEGTTIASRVYKLELKENAVVDIILQNANALNPNVSEIHPWHLHGHDFYVLGYGEGKFTEEDKARYNLKDPPLRNSEVIFPYGWTGLRFVADNPGVWAFHCHIEMHMEMGMGVVLSYGLDRLGTVPEEGLKCGKNK